MWHKINTKISTKISSKNPQKIHTFRIAQHRYTESTPPSMVMGDPQSTSFCEEVLEKRERKRRKIRKIRKNKKKKKLNKSTPSFNLTFAFSNDAAPAEILNTPSTPTPFSSMY